MSADESGRPPPGRRSGPGGHHSRQSRLSADGLTADTATVALPDANPRQAATVTAAVAQPAAVDNQGTTLQLRRRREAARRLPRLPRCGPDPWMAGHERWRDEWDLAMARAGWAEPWQVERARQVWTQRRRSA